VALGLSYVHSFGIIHRDIKPENILIDKSRSLVKLIDFGLAIHESQVTTDYIATRWYRAPENLLETKEYTCAIDVFSLGCVIVELYLGSPLFPGSNNIDQLYKMFNVLGFPMESNWSSGWKKMVALGVKMNKNDGKATINLK
jgi:serine/threonine protein kinase